MSNREHIMEARREQILESAIREVLDAYGDKGWASSEMCRRLRAALDAPVRESDAPPVAVARDPHRRFPVIRERDAKAHPLTIPWSVAEKAYAVYSAQYGSAQSLERMAERGGFYPSELDGLHPTWREESDEIAELRAECARLRGEATVRE